MNDLNARSREFVSKDASVGGGENDGVPLVAHVVNLQLQFNDLRYLSSFGGAINRQASRI